MNTNFNYFCQKKQFLLKAAEKHSKANKIGKEQYPADYCLCCKQNSNKIPFASDCDINEFSSIGRGYSLYFKTIELITSFIKYLVLFNLFYLIASKNWYGIEINKSMILNEMNFFTLIFFVFWIDYKIKIYENNLMENSLPDISDFSIMLSSVKGNNIIELDNNLRTFLNKINNHNGINYEPFDMSFCFKCKEYIKLKKRFLIVKNKILDINEKIFFFSENEKMSSKLKNEKHKLTEDIRIINKQIEILSLVFNSIKNGENFDSFFNGKVFVTFDDHKVALDFLDKYENEDYRIFNFTLYYLKKLVKKIKNKRFEPKLDKNQFKEYFIYKKKFFSFKTTYFKKELIFNNNLIYVSKGVNPKNINWRNIHYNFIYKKIFRFLIFVVSFLFLSGSFLLVLYINQFRYQFINSSNKPKQINFIFNLSISSLILLFNTLLTLLIEKTIKYELHVKKTGELSSIIKKVILKMFLNASLTILIISIKECSINKDFLFSQLFTFTLACIVVYPIINYLDPFYIYYLLKKSHYENKSKINLNQKKLNKIFTPPDYNIIMNYSAFIFFLFHMVLFLPFYPIWIAASVLIFYITHYRVQKFMFINRYSSSIYFKNDLNLHILKIIKNLPLVFLFGNFVKEVFYLKLSLCYWYFNCKLILAIFVVILPDNILNVFFTIPSHCYGFLDQYPHLLNSSVFYNQHNPINSNNFLE